MPKKRALTCPEIGQKWFLFSFCLSGSDIGLFGGQVLAVLKMENHGFGHQADLIIAEPHTGTFSLTLHSSKKADTARRPKADARPKIAPNHKKRIKTIFNHFRNRHAR
jgi:hypothetical protein